MTYADAKALLKDVTEPNGDLYSLGWYLSWNVNDGTATLDGEFTPEDLEAIAVYMRGTKE